MKNAFRWLAVFAASLVVAKVVENLLTTAPGRRLMERTGSTALLTDEGMDVVRRYSKEAVEVVLDTLFNRRIHRDDTQRIHLHSGWANTVEDAAYIISGVGSLMRVVVDFMRERQELGSKRD